MADDAVRLYGEERYIRPNLSIAPSALLVAQEPIRISPFVVLSLPQRCIQTTTEVGLRLQPSFTTTIPSDRPPYTPAPSQSSDSPSANHSGSGIEPGGWVNPQDKGKKSEEKNGMEEEEHTHKEGNKCEFELAMSSMQADGSIEAIWINFEMSSHYRDYGGYSPEFHSQGFIFVSSGFRLDRCRKRVSIKLLNHTFSITHMPTLFE